METELLFWLWLTFRVLFIVLLFIFLISGIDDLLIDIFFIVRWTTRKFFKRRKIKPMTVEMLSKVPEKPVAIIIPAWQESPVILRMLFNTTASVLYKNYHIFVGTYPNDEATKLEVEKAREVYPNIDAIVTPKDGPTNKADCLNWVFEGIRLFEKNNDVKFAFYLMHDAEDIIHPLSLKYYNYLIPRFHFIQLPVFPLEAKWYQFVTGVYMDEFAESHTKDMRVRELISHTLPSAGVGTAISREALEYLAETNHNQVFDISSLTEDYVLGLRLDKFEGKKMFLQQNVVKESMELAHGAKNKKQEPLATREYFPSNFRQAVRQKSRWILGIALQGWGIGWARTCGQNYFLFRDRKSIVTNISVMFGYLLILYSGCMALLRSYTSINVPPLARPGELTFIGLITVTGMFVWRMGSRVLSSWHIYGPKHGLLAMPRLIVGNVLNFCATYCAIRQFVAAKFSNKNPEWIKTDHAFPSEDQLLHYRRRLGDLLLEKRLVSTAQLEEALEKQKQSGKPLGEVLLEMKVLWEEDLMGVLASQQNRVFVEIDPYATPQEVLELVPQPVALEHHIFPLAMEGDTLVLASDDIDSKERSETIKNLFDCPVSLRWSAKADILFAIKRAYAEEKPQANPHKSRLGEQLVESGAITAEGLKEALRKQKRSDKKLGEVLIEMGIISPEKLKEELDKLD